MSRAKPVALVVEDEPKMRRFLRAALDSHGYDVIEAADGGEAVARLTSHNPAIVLLDLGLPDVDGTALTGRIREWSRVPIIVLSARGRDQDKVAVLDAGADDYLTKPFSVTELLARMRVAMRHALEASGSSTAQQFRFGGLELDAVRRRVLRDGVEVHLTPLEYKLLLHLAQHAGKVLTHRQILHDVWGPAYASKTHYVRVHVVELRKKLEADPSRPKLLITEPGVGYRLRELDDATS